MLKCSISLDAFAWELDESIVGLGKTLFVEKQVFDTDNIGQGVWTFQVHDQQEQYEVELLIRSRIIRKVGCECTTFQKGQICAHMVAGFYALSEKLPKKELRNKSQTSIPISKKKVSDFIQMLPDDRMDELLINFAKKNRKFALIIRAGATPYEQESDKYKQLLFLVIRQVITQKKISVSGLNFINEVVYVLINELKNLLNNGDTSEVIAFTDEFLSAWPVIKNYEIPEKKKPHIALLQSLKLLEQAISIILAPELIEQITVMLARHVPIYNRLSEPVLEKLLAMIHKLANDAETQSKCAKYLEVVLESDVPFYDLRDVLDILVGWKHPSSRLTNIIEEDWTEVELNAFCQLAIENGHFELLSDLIELSQKREITPNFAQTLEDYLFLIARADGDEGHLIFLAETNFKKTGQIKYYKILKELVTEDWSKEAERLFDYFVKAKKSLPAALLLVDMSAWDELLELTQREADLSFLTKVDKYLLNHKTTETKKLYAALLSKYFDQHLGEKPVDTYVYVQSHLKSIGYMDFATEIRSWMQKRYSHRTLLKSVF